MRMAEQLRLLKQVVNEAAGEKTPEVYPLGYIEDFFELRTKLGACFRNRFRGRGWRLEEP